MYISELRIEQLSHSHVVNKTNKKKVLCLNCAEKRSIIVRSSLLKYAYYFEAYVEVRKVRHHN